MPWCPKCKAEYREGFTECATCHVPLVDELPDEQDMEQMPDAVQAEPAPEEAVQLENPIGRRARYTMQVMVGAADTARARALIDETKQALETEQMDEDELARLAEEQAMQTPEQPMEDNTSFKLLPVVAAVIVVALVLLYLVGR